MAIGLCAVVAVGAENPSPEAVLEIARKNAAVLARAAPNYIVKRTIYRYRGVRRPASDKTSAGISMWQLLDTVSGSLTLDQGNEVYSNLTVNGFPATNIPSGISTSGELSTEPQMVLAPEVRAVFKGPKRDNLRKHRTYRYDFSIDQVHSTWHLDVGRLPGTTTAESCVPAFSGRIWIDVESGETVRIEASTSSVPKGFPLDWVALRTDYEAITVGTRSFALPVHSNAYACMSQPEKIHDMACYWNESLFSNYERFSVDSSAQFSPANK